MKYLFIISTIFLSICPTIVTAKDGSISAAEGWNNSAGFQTSYDKLVKLTTAEAIERQNGGYYDQWSQNNLYVSNVTIGAQTVFSESSLENVQINTGNCGAVGGLTNIESPGETRNTIDGAPCQVENSNATQN